jgi:hypothetical protein
MENNGRFIATVFQPKQSLGKTPGMPTVSNLLRLKTAIARELQGSAVIRNRPHNVVWSAMKRANHLIRKADREALATTTTMPIPCFAGQSLLTKPRRKAGPVVNMKDDWKSLFPTDRTKPTSEIETRTPRARSRIGAYYHRPGPDRAYDEDDDGDSVEYHHTGLGRDTPRHAQVLWLPG